MRLTYRLALLFGIFASFTMGKTASAQDGPPFYAPGYAQPTMNAAYGNNPQVLAPPGQAANYQPYPGLDLFRFSRQETYNSQGLWFQNFLNRNRTYKGSIEHMIVAFGQPGDALIGSPQGRRLPDLLADTTEDTLNETANEQVLTAYFPALTMDVFGEDANTQGIRLRWGWENEDGTELEFNGWYAGEGQHNLFINNGLAGLELIDPDAANDLRDEFEIVGVSAISVFNPGIPVVDGLGGENDRLVFDEFFALSFETTAHGAGATFVNRPLIRRDGISLKPIWGIRYLHINETLFFAGSDSGADFVFGIPSDRLGLPEDNTTVPLLGVRDSTLESSARSFIGGPEIGIRLDLGDNDLKVKFHAVSGLGANYHRLELQGDDFGNQLLSDGTFADVFNDTPFSDEETQTTVSPFAEVGVNAEIRIIQYIPLLNKVDLLDDALLTLSGNYLVAGLVAKPQESVVYQSLPLTPVLNVERGTWEMFSFNWGLTFVY